MAGVLTGLTGCGASGAKSSPASEHFVATPLRGTAGTDAVAPRLILPGAFGLPARMRPNGNAWFPLFPPGAPRLLGYLVLCATGGSPLRVTAVRPTSSRNLTVIAFGTKAFRFPLGRSQMMEDSEHTLAQDGFDSASPVVTPCPPGYEHELPSTSLATTQLGIQLSAPQLGGGYASGFEIAYRSDAGYRGILEADLPVCIGHGPPGLAAPLLRFCASKPYTPSG